MKLKLIFRDQRNKLTQEVSSAFSGKLNILLRLPAPEEIASLVAFLCLPAASYTTRQEELKACLNDCKSNGLVVSGSVRDQRDKLIQWQAQHSFLCRFIIIFFFLQKSKASDASEETINTTFDINVFGTITLTKLVTPHMLKQGGGHFVVISSAAGKVPSPGQAIYSASKHALHGYFHSLRSEFCQEGIKVTVVIPGPIETLNGTGTSTSEDKKSHEKRVSSE
ncbi:putative oxidoreductase [Arabidopsis thaliana]